MPQKPYQDPALSQIASVSSALATLGQRQLVLVSGDESWGWHWVSNALQAASRAHPAMTSSASSCLVVGSKSKHFDLHVQSLSESLGDRLSVTSARPEKPTTLLGYETAHVVFDAHKGLYPDALCAVAGTIKPGGFLFILCPPIATWPSHPDEFARKRTSFGLSTEFSSPNMVTRLIRHTLKCGATLIEPKSSNVPLTLAQSCRQAAESSLWQPITDTTAEQRQIISDILSSGFCKPRLNRERRLNNNANSHTDAGPLTFRNESANDSENPHGSLSLSADQRCYHVITADRGRGKSHLLGLLARALSDANEDNGINYILTGPNKASVGTVYKAFDHHDRNLPLSEHPLRFIAPEDILDAADTNSIVIVDEAASLPIPLLKHWANRFPNMIFATTTHGYEGTGKGFQIRFMNHLTSLTDCVYTHTLSRPIRYAANDPLEKSLFSVFCLDSEPKGLALTAKDVKTEHIQYEQISTTALLENEPSLDDKSRSSLLNEVFSLLVQAHYQTRPSDLRDILDAPGVCVFIARDTLHDCVLSACLTFDEGDFHEQHESLIEAIKLGKRRPSGHLVPQVLTLHMGQADALTLKSARIVRVATLPNLQRLNIGSRLVAFVSSTLKKQHYDFVSSSYADTPDVRSFWQKNGFSLVRLGNKFDQSSGTRSGLVLHGLSNSGAQLQMRTERFFSHQSQRHASASTLTATEKQLIETFIQHTGSYEAVKDILNRCEDWGVRFKDKHYPKKAGADFRALVGDWYNLTD